MIFSVLERRGRNTGFALAGILTQRQSTSPKYSRHQPTPLGLGSLQGAVFGLKRSEIQDPISDRPESKEEPVVYELYMSLRIGCTSFRMLRSAHDI